MRKDSRDRKSLMGISVDVTHIVFIIEDGTIHEADKQSC